MAGKGGEDLGVAIEQFELGCHLYSGIGIARDLCRSAELFRLAADQGHPESCLRFGDCLKDGIGIPKNHELAISYYSKAVNFEYVPAFDRLGLILELTDPITAVQNYRRATGYPPAQVHLGRCYEHGIGCPIDLPGAVRLYKAAAETNVLSPMRTKPSIFHL
jgi:TPR repeat protein